MRQWRCPSACRWCLTWQAIFLSTMNSVTVENKALVSLGRGSLFPKLVTSSCLFQNLALLYPSSIFIQIADALFCLFIQADEYICVVCRGVKLIKYRHFLFSDTPFRFPPVCYLGDPSEAFPISRIRLHGDAPPNISSGRTGFIWKILFENSCLKRLLFMEWTAPPTAKDPHILFMTT